MCSQRRGFFALKEQKQRSRVSQLIKNIRMSSDWLRVALLLSEISRSMACSALHGKDRTMLMLLWVCSFEKWWNSQCAREVVISFAGFCSSLIFIFRLSGTLDYPDYFVWSQRVRIIKLSLILVKKKRERAGVTVGGHVAWGRQLNLYFLGKLQFLFLEAFRLCHRLKEHHLKLGELLILLIAQASVNQSFRKQVCKLKTCRMCEYIFDGFL